MRKKVIDHLYGPGSLTFRGGEPGDADPRLLCSYPEDSGAALANDLDCDFLALGVEFP